MDPYGPEKSPKIRKKFALLGAFKGPCTLPGATICPEDLLRLSLHGLTFLEGPAVDPRHQQLLGQRHVDRPQRPDHPQHQDDRLQPRVDV